MIDCRPSLPEMSEIRARCDWLQALAELAAERDAALEERDDAASERALCDSRLEQLLRDAEVSAQSTGVGGYVGGVGGEGWWRVVEGEWWALG